jgi:hypothetical protein
MREEETGDVGVGLEIDRVAINTALPITARRATTTSTFPIGVPVDVGRGL